MGSLRSRKELRKGPIRTLFRKLMPLVAAMSIPACATAALQERARPKPLPKPGPVSVKKTRIDHFVDALGDPDLQRPMISVLASIGEKAVPALVKALDSDDRYKADGALEALVMMASERAVAPLAEKLKGKTLDDAAWKLRWIAERNPKSVPELVKVLPKIIDAFREDKAFGTILLLTKIGEKAVPGLEKAMKHKHHMIRAKAVIAYAMIRKKKALPVLHRMRNDPHETVRAAAETSAENISERREDPTDRTGLLKSLPAD